MQNFVYRANPARVLFGSGTIHQVAGELAELGKSKPLLLCTPQQTDQAARLEAILAADAEKRVAVAGIFAEATMHTPVEVTERAVAAAQAAGCDSVVSIGGGSTIGLGKAISLRTGLYHVAIATTYAGSEVTPILGQTENGRKTTQTDPGRILPGTVVYDVDLTLSLPAALSATSGVNAIAHAVEAVYARNGSPVIDLLAAEGVRALAAALPTLVAAPADVPARSQALYGAWLCGTCLGSVGMALHHKLCHALGGTLNLPHAETHTVVLPHALAYNAPALPPATLAKLAAALPASDGDPVRGLNVLLARLGVARSLGALGMREADIDTAADVATSQPYWNPRAVEKAKIRELIRRAWAGEDARADL